MTDLRTAAECPCPAHREIRDLELTLQSHPTHEKTIRSAIRGVMAAIAYPEGDWIVDCYSVEDQQKIMDAHWPTDE